MTIKKLLFVAATLLVGGGSVQMFAYQTPTDGGIYYLYNTACTDGTPGFMSTGNGYGFQVVIDNFGFPVKLISTGTANTYQFQFIHHNGYLSDDGFMYSDGGTDRARTITIQDQGDGKYKLLNTNNGKEIEDWYGNVVGDGTGNRHNFLWQFLSKDERNAMIAGYTQSQKLTAANAMGITLSEQTSDAFDAYISTNYIGIDNSSKIQNGTFDTTHNTEGWTTSANSNRSFNIGWGNSDPKTTPEVYEGAGAITQKVTVDKVGLYKVSVNATYRCGNADNNNRIGDLGYDGCVAYLKANNNFTKLSDWYSGKIDGNGPGSPSEANSKYFSAGKYYTEVYVYVGEEKTIDISIESHAFTWGGWLMFNNFKLTYYSDEVGAEDATAILSQANSISEPMEPGVQSALTSAISTFESSKTIANYKALNEAINNAQISVAAYANAKAYLDEAEAVLAGTNVYTAEAYATYYTGPKAKYDARTLTNAEANALVKTSIGWHSINTIDDILLSSWTIGGEQAVNYDKALYINTWSVEGNTDGSDFLAPFFEYWTDNGNSLDAKNIVATVTGLKANTTYSFTIRARVRQTNDKTKIANGITMKVGEGTPVDISSGAQFNGGQFYIGNFSAMGETDAEGNLTATITVAESSNISWLSFYNAKYTEGEDLSAYIADYEFALSTADANSKNAAYAAVTGKEKADLTSALSTYASVDNEDKAALIAAKEALEAASNTFVKAAPAYNAFVELNRNVASTLGVILPTITSATVAGDLKVEDYIVDEYTAAKAYPEDFTAKLGAWTNAPDTNKGESWKDDAEDTYYDEYNKADRSMTQTIVLPAGDYALIAKGRASVNGRLTVTDGTETVTFAHKNSSGRGIDTDGNATFDGGATYTNSNNGRGWEYRVLTFTSNGDAATTLTFNWKTSGSNWVGLDDIELRANPATLDYSNLQTAYNEVSVPTLGFEVGEYAPYVNAENLAKIAEAKSMLDNEDATSQTKIDALVTVLTSMTWTANAAEVNAIYNGDFALSAANTTSGSDLDIPGWTANGSIRQVIADGVNGTFPALTETTGSKALFTWGGTFKYGETAGYTIPLKAHSIYELTFKHAGWDGANNSFSVSITDANGNVLPTQNVGKSTHGPQTAGCWDTYRVIFATTDASDVVLNMIPNGNSTFTDITLFKSELTIADDAALPSYAAGTYPSVKVTRSIKAGKNTLVLPFSMTEEQVKATFGDNAKVYTVSKFDNDNITFASQTTINANEPCILVSENAVSELNLTNVAVAAATANPTKEGTSVKMIGSYAASTEIAADANNYVVSGNELWLVEGSAVTMKGTRAYIQIEVSGTAPSRLTWSFDEADATAIDEIVNGKSVNGQSIYNLQGQQLNSLQRGINIVGGKKVLVK